MKEVFLNLDALSLAVDFFILRLENDMQISFAECLVKALELQEGDAAQTASDDDSTIPGEGETRSQPELNAEPALAEQDFTPSIGWAAIVIAKCCLCNSDVRTNAFDPHPLCDKCCAEIGIV